MINTIIDTYHGNSINFKKVMEAGIIAVIHKVTQGAGIQDSTFSERKAEAEKLGLL